MDSLKNRILKHPLFSGSFLMIGGSMLVNVVNYVYHLTMGRILGPESYGVLASLFSILYITSIVPGSASLAIVKFISSAKDKRERTSIYNAIKSFILKLSLGAAAAIMVTSPFIASFLNVKDVFSVVLVAPILFFSLITLVNQSTLQGILNFYGVVGPNLISSIGKLLLGVLFVLVGFSVLGAMWGVLLGVVFAYILSVLLIRGNIGSDHKKGFNLKPFFKYSLPVLIQAFAFTSIFTTDVILVKHFFSAYEAGIYAALSTLGKIIFFAASPVTGVMFPVIAGRVSRGERYLKILLISIGLTSLISLGILFIYFLFPTYAITILYGSQYLAAKEGLVWMGLFISFYSLSYVLTNFFLSAGNTKVVILPLSVAVVQIILIWFRHSSYLDVIMISLGLVAFLFLALGLLLGYNSLNAKKNKA